MQAIVRDAMSTDVVTIPRQTTIADAERLLIQKSVDELFVTNEKGRLVGTLPDYELLKLRMRGPVKPDATIESLTSRRFLVIGADSPLSIALRYLREHVHHRLAVVEDMRLVGRVTRQSALRLLAEMPVDAPAEKAGPPIPRPRILSGSLRPSRNTIVSGMQDR